MPKIPITLNSMTAVAAQLLFTSVGLAPSVRATEMRGGCVAALGEDC